MSSVVFILLATVLFADRLPGFAAERGAGWAALAAVLLPPALALVAQTLAVRRADRMLERGDPRGARAVGRADAATRIVAWAGAIGLAIACFGFGWVAVVRAAIGDLPALDEFLAMAPALAAMALSWWIDEPIERRVREASLVRRLDEGLPIPPSPSRLGFVATRLRTTVLLLLVPMLLVLGLGELLAPRAAALAPEGWGTASSDAALFASAAIVYLGAPLLARAILSLRPLPQGALRDDLLDVARSSRVRIGQIYLWNTHYAMVNGAVLGVVPRLRFVLLTDALLELLPRDQLRAVMAHEVGHVRRRHLPWLLVALVALLALATPVAAWPLERVLDAAERSTMDDASLDLLADWLGRCAVLGAGLLGLVGFGWVSRRFERQADVFAVQTLSRASGSPTVTAEAVRAMTGALESVAIHAGVDPARRSWRHGSIRWRQRYLLGTVGAGLERVPIDRLVLAIKAAAALGAALVLWQLIAG